MKLLASSTSPYARKLRILAHELGLALTFVETAADGGPRGTAGSQPARQGAGAVPITAPRLFDSRSHQPATCWHLRPATRCCRRARTRSTAALGGRTSEAIADGILDAVIIMRFNAAPGVTSGEWIDRQRRAIDRASQCSPAGSPTSSTFAMLCTIIACEYLDLRWPEIDWRTATHPQPYTRWPTAA